VAGDRVGGLSRVLLLLLQALPLVIAAAVLGGTTTGDDFAGDLTVSLPRMLAIEKDPLEGGVEGLGSAAERAKSGLVFPAISFCWSFSRLEWVAIRGGLAAKWLWKAKDAGLRLKW